MGVERGWSCTGGLYGEECAGQRAGETRETNRLVLALQVKEGPVRSRSSAVCGRATIFASSLNNILRVFSHTCRYQ